jgi:hypothetical protein
MPEKNKNISMISIEKNEVYKRLKSKSNNSISLHTQVSIMEIDFIPGTNNPMNQTDEATGSSTPSMSYV